MGSFSHKAIDIRGLSLSEPSPHIQTAAQSIDNWSTARFGLTSLKRHAPNTSSASIIANLITLNGTVATTPSHMLVDGGSSCNFISQSLANRIKLETWRLPSRIKVKMANGASVSCLDKLPDVEIEVAGGIVVFTIS